MVDASKSEDFIAPLDNDQLAADFTYLHSVCDIRKITFTSHRRILGRLVIAAKTVLRKLIAPILERQTAFNAASLRVTSRLMDETDRLREETAQLKERIDTLERLHREALQAADEGVQGS